MADTELILEKKQQQALSHHLNEALDVTMNGWAIINLYKHKELTIT